MNPGDQFLGIMNKLGKKAPDAMAAFVEDVGVRMKANARAGKSFPGEFYQRNYAKSTAQERRRLGLQISKVDLQRFLKRIDKTASRRLTDGATLYFTIGKVKVRGKGRRQLTAGQLMYVHHHGLGNLPIRTVFPKSHDSVPKESKSIIFKTLIKTFNDL